MDLKLVAGSAIVVSLLVAACGSPPTTTTLPPQDSGAVQSAQAIVDAFAAAQPAGGIPDHFLTDDYRDVPRSPDDFDINTYFGVLTHLAVEPGWVIDYLYEASGMGGGPFVYARPAGEPPYASLEDYVAATSSPTGNDDERDLSREYLEHIAIDGSREGFFQFVTLMLMDDQFYLYWHAGYNDTTLVCDRDALETTMAAAGSAFEGDGLPGDVQKAARRLDLTPTVVFPDDSTAVVRMVTFSKWGGFVESQYTVSRDFPHAILDENRTTLVEYDCGVQF